MTSATDFGSEMPVIKQVIKLSRESPFKQTRQILSRLASLDDFCHVTSVDPYSPSSPQILRMADRGIRTAKRGPDVSYASSPIWTPPLTSEFEFSTLAYNITFQKSPIP
jgi:hypothetical protein